MRRRLKQVGKLPSLLLQFAVISFVLLAAVGIVLGRRLGDIQERRSLEDAINSAQIVAEAGIKPLLTPEDLQRDFVPLDDAALARLNPPLQAAISDEGIVRIKIWNMSHWIVYSDNELLVGRWFAGDAALERALEGSTTSEVTDLSGPENLEERDFGRLLAVYVPLRIVDGVFSTDESAEVVGAFEIYVPYAPIATAIENDTRTLYISLAVGFVVLYLSLFRLVAGASRRLRRQATENAFQASHDVLTGLRNRTGMLEAVGAKLATLGHDDQFTVMLLDLERFKEINDALGHAAGDELLKAIASRLSDSLDTCDVFHLGADEFIIAGPTETWSAQPDAGDQVGPWVDHVTALLDEPFDLFGVQICARGSLGVVIAPEHGQTPEHLARRADQAMHVAKEAARVSQVWSPELDESSPERLGLAADLRGALAGAPGHGRIYAVYQPKLSLTTGTVTSVEALVRWQHPTRGAIAPNDFLPIIENTELIGTLTWEVLDQALASCANWHRMGLDLGVAVNVSARTIGSPELVDRVRAALERHGVPASSLELELTESALLGDRRRATDNLVQLRRMGIGVAIDDFGTGYASIGYLTSMPVTVLKIDRSFVAAMLDDAAAAAIVEFSIGLAAQLGLKVVAEGVETAVVLDALRTRGCDLAQGFYLSRPIDAHDLVVWLMKWNTRHLVPAHHANGLDAENVADTASDLAANIAADFDGEAVSV